MRKLPIGILLVLLVFGGVVGLKAPMIHASPRINYGLVAYYSFDHCDARDDSGNGHDGTIYGNPKCVDGPVGKSFEFDGSSYIEVPYSSQLAPPCYTVNVWFKPLKEFYVGESGREIVSKGIDKLYYEIQWGGPRANDNNEVEFWLENSEDDDAFVYSSPISTNVWHMATMEYCNGILKAYIDGKLVNETTVSITPYDDGEDLYIATADSGYFVGAIDEVRIYNRVLGLEEVQALYEQGLNGKNSTNQTTETVLNHKVTIEKKVQSTQSTKVVSNKTVQITYKATTAVYQVKVEVNGVEKPGYLVQHNISITNVQGNAKVFRTIYNVSKDIAYSVDDMILPPNAIILQREPVIALDIKDPKEGEKVNQSVIILTDVSENKFLQGVKITHKVLTSHGEENVVSEGEQSNAEGISSSTSSALIASSTTTSEGGSGWETSFQTSKGSGICGPAFVVALAIFPLLYRRKR